MPKILLVETDENLISSYVGMLQSEKHQVITARDGQEGLNKFFNGQFDLIITELNLPKVTGQKMIEQLQNSRNGDLPCSLIISSSNIDSKTIQSLASHNKVHFLPKPSSNDEFLNKIRNVLDKSKTSPKVDVRFINPILESTVSVIAEMTGFTVTSGKPEVKFAGEFSGDISGVVGLVSSGFKGNISLSFTEPGFLKIISTMFGEEVTAITEENKDAVAELLNIIFGKTKKILNEDGLNIQPAIPTIIRGKNHSIEHQTKHATIVIPFQSPEIGHFRVEVSIASS
jgi:chemotaxis protein CheX